MEENLLKLDRYLNKIQVKPEIGHWEFLHDIKKINSNSTIHNIFEEVFPQFFSIFSLRKHIERKNLIYFIKQFKNAMLKNVMFSGKKNKTKFNIRTKKQKTIEVYLFFNQDKKNKIYGTFQDITDIKKYKEAVKRQNKKLELIFENSNLMLWELNLITNDLDVERKTVDKLNIPEVFKSSDWINILTEDSKIIYSENFNLIKTQKSKKKYQIEYILLNNSKKKIWIQENGTVFFDNETKKPIFITGTWKDITEEKEKEIKIKNSHHFFCETTDGILVLNSELEIENINKSFSVITSYSEKDVRGANVSIIFSTYKEDIKKFKEIIEVVKHIGRWKGEFNCRKKDGTFFPAWISITTISNSFNNNDFMVVINDITEIKSSQAKLNFLSYYDKLTNLPNKNLLKERLIHTMYQKKNKKICLIYIDIDRFKNIIDAVGYDIGENILKEVSSRLTNIKSDFDDVFRVDGDEFIYLIEDFKNEFEVVKKLESISKLFEESFVLNGENIFYLTASMGVSIFPNDGEDVDTLIKNANTAMYKAKENGRNTYHFYESKLSETAFEKVVMENSLREAIKNEEFVLYYQPQINIKTKKIVAAEALIRWKHPKIGLIPPFKFLGIAEETGLITEIGKWVIEETCRQYKRFEDKGVELSHLSANISGGQLYNSKLTEVVIEAIKKSNIKSHQLELEITEEFLIKDLEKSMEILNDLKKQNIKIALDDFGTGYSSLAYLKKFPIDTLKIDQIFIRDIVTDREDREITKAIIDLGNALHLSIVVEGVETRDHKDILENFNCSIFQGYFYSRPIPADEFEKFYFEYRENNKNIEIKELIDINNEQMIINLEDVC